MTAAPCAENAAAVRAHPLDAGAALALAACIVDAGDVSYGDVPFRRLAVLEPSGLAWAAWGRASAAAGDAERAARLLRRAVRCGPMRAQGWSDLGNALAVLKSPDAVRAAERAAVLAPNVSDHLCNLGVERRAVDRIADADCLFGRALRLDPSLPQAWEGRAGLIVQSGGSEQAARFFLHRAAASDPALAAALNLAGVTAARRGDAAAAAAWYGRALRVDPSFAEASLNRALQNLKNGDLSAGWLDYRRRFAGRGYVDRPMPFPPWRGEDLTGKRVLVWREQGVGDEILFSGCLADVMKAAGEAVFECDPRLVGLFARSFPGLRCVPAGGNLGGGFDFHVPLGDLPERFRSRLSSFPAAPWLVPDPAAAARWRGRLDALPPGLNVGLSWKSGLVTAERASAYTAFADWAGLFRTPGVNVVNLQYGDCAAEIAAAPAMGGVLRVWDDLDLKNDLEQTAALCACLDLVVCPATAVGELAGALGTPVWRVGGVDWTMLGTGGRPWFAAQRLFTPAAGETTGDAARRLVGRLLAVKEAGNAGRRNDENGVDENGGDENGGDGPATFDRALASYRDGRIEEAADVCRRALRREPENAALRHLAGVAANRLGRHDDAVRALAPVVATRGPAATAAAGLAALATLTAALKGVGAAASAADRPAAAVAAYRRAAAVQPDDRGATVNLGAALYAAGRIDQARRTALRALTLNPDDADAAANLGLALQAAGDQTGAIEAFRRAAARDPKHAVARYNLALLLLARGALREGWSEHDRRFATPQFRGQGRKFAAPLWRGENIAGKRLLIWREQGVGDEFMFASCCADAVRRAGVVVVQCDRRLVKLFARSFPTALVVAEDAPVPPHDFHIPAGSLPRRLRGDLSRFVASQPFSPQPADRSYGWLRADPAQAAQWRRRLDALGPALKIGLAWRSRLMTGARRDAYINALDWAPVLRLPGARFINLQIGGDVAAETAAVRDRIGVEIVQWDDLDLMNDLDGAAALTSQLDLVLSPATSAGELAGALGVPTWRLGGVDWTQLATGVRPWYPAMRIWNPKPGEALSDVPAAMARELRRIVAFGGAAFGGAVFDGAFGTAAPETAAPETAGCGTVAPEAAAAAGRAASPPRRRAATPAPGAVQTAALERAQAAFAAGDVAGAVRAFALIVDADPACAPAWTGIGACLAENGDDDGAAFALRRALALRPDDAAALTTLGNGCFRRGAFAAAAVFGARAVRSSPGFAPALGNLAAALEALGKDEEAEKYSRAALDADAGLLGARLALSAALRRQGKPLAARRALNNALIVAPGEADVLANLLRLLRAAGRASPDDPWMDRAHRLAPDDPATAFNRGLALLAAGRTAEGWAGYERRFAAAETRWAVPAVDAAPWRGESTDRKTLLVWGEQGVGDQIMFASMLPDLAAWVAAQGGRVVVAPEPRLASLFRRSFPGATVVESAARAGPVDFHCGMGSVGALLRRRTADFPADRPAFLHPDPALLGLWRDRLAAAAPFALRVGLCWRSGLLTGERRLEYTDLAAWRALAATPGVALFNLTYDAAAEIAAAAAQGMRLHGWDDLDLKNDFEATAALTAGLDLVVAPATAVGELAAAVGVPTWRFGLGGDWTRLGAAVRPWFPAQRLFLVRDGETMNDAAARLTQALAAGLPHR